MAWLRGGSTGSACRTRPCSRATWPQWKRFDDKWDGYIKPESYEPGFEPTLGIVLNSQELALLRREHSAHLKQHGDSPFTRAAADAAKLVPEQMISDYVNFWNDTRYCRERDYSNLLLFKSPGANAAIAGLLMKDKTLLRLAARYAMAIAMCDHWDDGMICFFPGSNFEHRCFVQSLCTHEVALILDLAGEMFTDMGRDYLLRRIAEEGLGNINFITWKHEYIFHMNQLAWFTPGRMLGYLTLERYWKHVEPYTEIAYQNLIENLSDSVLPDGGYVEGPTYFRCVARDGGLPLYYYARARGKDFNAIIPESMKRTSTFAEALSSTTAGDVIPICDGRPQMEQEAAAVMAALLPQSQWTTIFHKTLARTGGMAETILAWQMSKNVPQQEPQRQPFIFLPIMGVMASARKLGQRRCQAVHHGQQGRRRPYARGQGQLCARVRRRDLCHGPGHVRLCAPAVADAQNMPAPQHARSRRHHRPAAPTKPAAVRRQAAGERRRNASSCHNDPDAGLGAVLQEVGAHMGLAHAGYADDQR